MNAEDILAELGDIYANRHQWNRKRRERGQRYMGWVCTYIPEEIIQDILSHADHLNLPRETLVRKAISACDEITGLITAVALVRPSRSLYDLEPSSVKKKWKDKAFAAGTSRTEMEHAAKEFGIELWEHVGNVIQAMRRIAPELGLEGNIPKP